MPSDTAHLAPPLNYVFVDFENVQKIDLTVIGDQAVNFTLLVGPRQTKLGVDLVEKLFEHAASVQLVRLATSGKNALDFIITYYVGRAVALDPTGRFHIVSRDKGFDPLIEHLRSKRIQAERHDSFADLALAPVAKSATPTAPVAPVAVSKPKAPAKPKPQRPVLDEPASRVLEHLRKSKATHPKNQKKLVSYLIAQLGHKITETEALTIIENLKRAGHIAIDEKGKVAYHLSK